MSEAWRELRWTIAYLISRAGLAVGRYLPTRLCYLVATPIASLCFLAMRRQRRALVENLERVVGPEEATAAARRAFGNFARYIIDFYQLPLLGVEALKRRIDFHDWQPLDEALNDSNGALFVTLHLGQAELGGAALTANGYRVNVVAQPLSHAAMNRLIQGLRTALGMKVMPAHKARSGVLRCLTRGETLALMFDAVGPGEGIVVDFFGAPAEMSGTPARVAIRTGARVLPAVVSRDPRDPMKFLPSIDFNLRFQATGDEEADVRRLTQAIATSLEAFIRRFPDQWFAFRPVWASEKRPPPPAADWKVWSLRSAVFLTGLLPRALSYGLARLAGDLAYDRRRAAREAVQDNMRHVLGPSAGEAEVDRAAHEVFRNVARYYVDLTRLARMKPEQLLAQVHMHGFERLKSLLDAGQGVVVATAHYGSPEVAVQVGALLGLDTLVLVEPLQPPAFARLMQRVRSVFKPRYEVVGFGSVAESLRHLRRGGCVAITCDRNVQGSGAVLPFFGAPARLPLGAVELAARTGAVLLPGYCRRKDDGYEIYFDEPVALRDSGDAREDALSNARQLLARIEPWIQADPGQWLPLERIWLPQTCVPEGQAPLQEPRQESPVP